MERGDREKHAQTENDLRMKIFIYKGDFTKGHVII